MFEYDTVNRWVFSRLRKVSSDGADVTSGGRLTDQVHNATQFVLDVWLTVQQCVVLRLRLSSTGPCLAIPQVTWPMTVCQLIADACVRQLHSADTQTLAVSRMHSNFGDRTFAAAGPQVWNILPPNLRLCGLKYGQFRRLLKTFLFGQWSHGSVWTVFNCAK